MHVRVLTINVQHDQGGRRRTSVLNHELRRLAPDVVAFQEVCYPDRWDQLAELIDGAGLYATHQASVLDYLPPGAGHYGGTAVATAAPDRCRGRPAPGPGHRSSLVDVCRIGSGAGSR